MNSLQPNIPAQPTQAPISSNDPGVPPSTPANLEEQKRNAPKFAALIRKEKQALQKLQAASAKEHAISQREAALAAREAKIAEFENMRNQDPNKALEMLGWDYNRLTEAKLAGSMTPEMQIEQMKRDFERDRQQRESEKLDQQKKQEEAAVSEQQEIISAFQSEISSFVGFKKDEYPFINTYNQANLVYSTIDDHYNKTGKVATIKEACDHVEKYLEAEAEKAMQIERFRTKYVPQQQQKSDFSKEPWGNPKSAAQKTLSNSMSPAAQQEPPRRSLSEDEKIKRAVERIWGNR